MREIIFYHTAVALAAGMLAQTLAARLAIPSIVLLLGAGVLLGPELLGILDPGVFSTGRANGRENTADRLFPGAFPGIDEVNRMIRFDRLRVVQYEVLGGAAVGSTLAALPYGPQEFALLLRRGEGAFVAVGNLEVAKGDRLFCARPVKSASPLAESFRLVSEESPKRIEIEPAA